MAAPTGFAVQLGNNGQYGFPSVVCRWEDNGSDSYNIYQSESGGAYNLVGSTVARLTQFRVDGLRSATTYGFKVRGVVGGIESADSTIVSVTTETGTLVGSNFAIFSHVETPTTITIIWDGSSEQLTVYRSADGGITWQHWAELYYGPSAIGSKNTLYDDGLSPSTAYKYRWSVSQISMPSEVTYTTPARTGGFPVEPTGLTVTPSMAGIALAWTNSGGHVCEVQRAYYSYADEGPGTWSTINTTSAGATSFLDTTFTSRRGVFYRVRCAIGANKSDYITPLEKMISTPSPYRGGITVQVGYGTANPVMTDAILNALGPGDTVEWYWDGSNPFRQKINWSPCGTPDAWIEVIAMPHAGGSIPKIDGDGATAIGGSSVSDNYFVWGITPKAIDEVGYKPDYIRIRGFEICNGRPTNAYYDVTTGILTNFNDIAACIFVKSARNVEILGNYLHHAPNTVRTSSGRELRYYGATQRIIGNTFDQWGVDIGGNTGGSHACYSEGFANEISNNVFLDQFPGTGGMCVKNRGGDPLILGNVMANPTKNYDVIDSIGYFMPHILRQANYHRSRTAGNEFYAPPVAPYRASRIGADDDPWGKIRGPHYIYGNTFVSVTDPSSPGTIRWFRVDDGLNTTDTGLVIWGNAFVSATDGGTPRVFYMMEGDGTIQYGKNWFAEPINDSDSTAYVVGYDNSTIVAGGSPGFINLLGQNYRPDVGSILIDTFTSGPAGITPPTTEPRGGTRTQTGAARDLGAYEYITGPPGGTVAYFPAQYFAPTYFAPTYFQTIVPEPIPPVPSDGICFAPTYFAATYFAPTYFPGLPSGPAPPTPTPGSGRQPNRRWWHGLRSLRVKGRF